MWVITQVLFGHYPFDCIQSFTRKRVYLNGGYLAYRQEFVWLFLACAFEQIISILSLLHVSGSPIFCTKNLAKEIGDIFLKDNDLPRSTTNCGHESIPVLHVM